MGNYRICSQVHSRKPIVTISLKRVKVFIKQANLIKRYGAAVVVMAFDEKAADTLKKK